MTDAEWETIEPMLPSSAVDRQTRDARPAGVIMDAIMYVVRTRCAWLYLLVDCPPWQTDPGDNVLSAISTIRSG
ncbi:transposase [Micromonospora sp. DT41]|uniref:transposase n=1 Tax=Micromonospora sp. DT41 TaxID=3393437 RepID=UPI003CF9CF89